MNDDRIESLFWREGKKVLQNTQDRIQSTKTRLPADELESKTKTPKVPDRKNHTPFFDEDAEYEAASSVGDYDSTEHDLSMFESSSEHTSKNLNDLKKGQKMNSSDVISPRISSAESIFFKSEGSDDMVENNETSESNTSQNSSGAFDFGTLLAFVSGSTVGHKLNNEDEEFYEENKEESMGLDTAPACYKNDEIPIEESEWAQLGLSSDLKDCHFPTMKGVAMKIANESGVVLDDTQYVAYKVICASFMLNLI